MAVLQLETEKDNRNFIPQNNTSGSLPILGGHTIYCGSHILGETGNISNIHQAAET